MDPLSTFAHSLIWFNPPPQTPTPAPSFSPQTGLVVSKPPQMLTSSGQVLLPRTWLTASPGALPQGTLPSLALPAPACRNWAGRCPPCWPRLLLRHFSCFLIQNPALSPAVPLGDRHLLVFWSLTDDFSSWTTVFFIPLPYFNDPRGWPPDPWPLITLTSSPPMIFPTLWPSCPLLWLHPGPCHLPERRSGTPHPAPPPLALWPHPEFSSPPHWITPFLTHGPLFNLLPRLSCHRPPLSSPPSMDDTRGPALPFPHPGG